jgi:hypothetical protein
MSTLLIIILLLLLLGGVGSYPRWGYSAGWGYGPSGILSLLLVVLIVLALANHSPI